MKCRLLLSAVQVVTIFLIGGSMCATNQMCATNFCLASGYDKEELPPSNQALKDAFSTSMSIDLLDLQVRDDDVTVMMTVRLKLTWIDSRITLPAAQNQPQTKKSSHPVKPLPLDIFHRNLIWMPNLVTTFRTKILSDFFRTESDFVTLLATPSNQTKVQVQVVVKLNEPCPNMNFKNYPFDKHVCIFGFRSLEFADSLFQLKNDCIKYSEEEQSPKTYHVSVRPDRANRSEKSELIYSSVMFEVRLQRIVTALLISHYIPVTLFTLASFSSFSLALNHGNDRIGFLVTLFLVLVSMNISITNTSPGGNLITSVEWYTFVCMMFCFAALLEYGGLLAMLRRSTPKATSGTVGTFFDRHQPSEESEILCAKIDTIFANWIIMLFIIFWFVYFFISSIQYYL